MAGKGDRYRKVDPVEYAYGWRLIYDKCKVCENECKQDEHVRTRFCPDFAESKEERAKVYKNS